ncbi:hypothetical protein M8C21_007962, partial [Ambrosia artemisiifolia]
GCEFGQEEEEEKVEVGCSCEESKSGCLEMTKRKKNDGTKVGVLHPTGRGCSEWRQTEKIHFDSFKDKSKLDIHIIPHIAINTYNILKHQGNLHAPLQRAVNLTMTAVMIIVEVDDGYVAVGHRGDGARKRRKRDVAELQQALADYQEQENAMLQVEQEQKLIEDARRYADC